MERNFCFNEHLQVPFEDAVRLLREHPDVVLGAAQESISMAETGQPREMHIVAPTPRKPHDVDVVVGPVHEVDRHAVMMPIRWTSVSRAGWFPEIDAEIELIDEAHQSPWIQVSFLGSYTPRMGIAGGLADAVATHTQVERTARQFLSAMCEHIREAVRLGAAASA